MELFALYLWLKLDALRGAALLPGALMAVGFAISFPLGMEFDHDTVGHRAVRRARWTMGPLATLLLLSALLLPSQKDAAILAGGYFALQAAHSPEGQKVTSLLRQRVNAYLDEQLTKGVK